MIHELPMTTLIDFSANIKHALSALFSEARKTFPQKTADDYRGCLSNHLYYTEHTNTYISTYLLARKCETTDPIDMKEEEKTRQTYLLYRFIQLQT